MIVIDKLSYEDLNGLKRLYEDAFEGSSTDFDNMIKTYNQIKDNANYNILCAKTDDKIVGSVMGIICNELYGKCLPFMVIENVAVLNGYRRSGIAKQLMMKLEDLAKVNNCTTILFVSSEHRTGAHKLYESLGYGVDKVNGYRKRLM
jgi:ribosomal protein S18 acetylase RimI-like enzyme